MFKINSREELKQYCLRKLGAPVLQINIADEQIEDRIDDAFDKFWEFHNEGSIETFLSREITNSDISRKSIIVPENIISVLDIISMNNVSMLSNLSIENLDRYAFFQNTIFSAYNFNASYYVITDYYLSIIKSLIGIVPKVRFNSHFGRIFLDDWSNITPGEILVFRCYVYSDPGDFPDIYNDMWLKDYTTALIKKQWGTNLIKYQGFELPGGISVNAEQIYNSAIEELADLEEKLLSYYTYPTDFFMG